MVDVTPQSLRQHASRIISGPMARVALAADAANQSELGDVEAYGIVFAQVVPPVLELFLDDAAGMLASVTALGDGFAEALADVANQYQDADREVEALFEDFLEELDGAAS